MKKGNCKHYNGDVYRRGRCDIGVNVRKLVGGSDLGWLTRTPCFKEKKSCIKCDLFREPTAEEIATYDAEVEESINRMKKVYPLISQLKVENPNGGSGSTACPVCGGVLRYSVAAYNRHVHGQCNTKDCLSWME